MFSAERSVPRDRRQCFRREGVFLVAQRQCFRQGRVFQCSKTMFFAISFYKSRKTSNDDRAIFTKSGNAFTLDFGTMHCDSDETNLTGTWALSNSDKTLTLNVTYMGVPFPITMDIMSVSDSKLVTREISQGDTTETTFNVTN